MGNRRWIILICGLLLVGLLMSVWLLSDKITLWFAEVEDARCMTEFDDAGGRYRIYCGSCEGKPAVVRLRLNGIGFWVEDNTACARETDYAEMSWHYEKSPVLGWSEGSGYFYCGKLLPEAVELLKADQSMMVTAFPNGEYSGLMIFHNDALPWNPDRVTDYFEEIA